MLNQKFSILVSFFFHLGNIMMTAHAVILAEDTASGRQPLVHGDDMLRLKACLGKCVSETFKL